MKILFSYLVFPGFLFAACVGLMAGWVDRKITARIQWRVGPPWYQNFVDVAKLVVKEVIMPEGAGITFLLAPYFGFLSVILVSTILGNAVFSSQAGLPADLIVVLYFLVVPAIAVIIGASSSKNPLASVGASREMKLVMSYELPFILAVIAVIIRCKGAIQMGGILSYQMSHGSNLSFSSGAAAFFSSALAFIVAVLCMQAKLGFAPFDAPEAEQEIMGGTLIEYSGLLLAIFKLTKAILVYIMPLLIIVLFWGKNLTPMALIGKYIALLVVIVLIKNTNPRLRIDQALRFFWGPMTVIAVLAVALALIGR